jgi:glycosyltransferase involved in cell wall biosynthesis
MRFFGVACVKNEANLIEAFVRHNLVYWERLMLLDHGSTDGTSAILQALRVEGLPLEIVSDDGIGKLQGARMSGLMREAARQGADWVFLLDADEFIRPRGGVLPEPPRDAPPVLKLAWPTHLVHGSGGAGGEQVKPAGVASADVGFPDGDRARAAAARAGRHLLEFLV